MGIFACDIDPECKKNYLANYKLDTDAKWFDDIKNINGSLYENKIDLLVGGSPCQSFSVAGLRKGLDDDRGLLIYEYLRLIKEIRPKKFIFENVKGFLTFNKGEIFNCLCNEFKKLGYDIEYKIISAKNINFPQSRERLFILGHRKDLPVNLCLHKISEQPLIRKVEDFLDQDVESKYYIYNQKWQKWIFDHTELDKQKMNINGDFIICQTARQYASWFGNFILEIKKDINFTYCQEALNLINQRKIIPINYDKDFFDLDYISKNSIIRKLTPNECLKLMGFNLNFFKSVCSNSQTYKQCGNSILVNMCDEILLKLYT